MRGLLLVAINCMFLCSCSILTPPNDNSKVANASRKLVQNLNYEQGIYFGFGIEKSKLKNPKWFYVAEQQQANAAIYRLPAISKSHTLFAKSAIYSIPKDTKDLKQLEPILKKAYLPTKQRQMISQDFKIIKYKGIQRIKYSLKYLDRAVEYRGKPLVMTFDGYVYFHPFIKDMAMCCYYSERGTEEEIKEGAFDNDGRDFLDAVKLLK